MGIVYSLYFIPCYHNKKTGRLKASFLMTELCHQKQKSFNRQYYKNTLWKLNLERRCYFNVRLFRKFTSRLASSSCFLYEDPYLLIGSQAHSRPRGTYIYGPLLKILGKHWAHFIASVITCYHILCLIFIRERLNKNYWCYIWTEAVQYSLFSFLELKIIYAVLWRAYFFSELQPRSNRWKVASLSLL